MKVVLTDEAIADLVRIGRFIKRDNLPRAETFMAELYDRCQRLGRTPMAFPLLPGREDTGIRRRRHGNYLIMYRVGLDAVEVLHIVHGAQDYDSILFPDG